MVVVLVAELAGVGTVDATLEDLGAGVAWTQVHRTGAPLRCRDCGAGCYARTGTRTIRHFAHHRRPDPQDCALAHESAAHRALKAEIAGHIRARGWRAVLEARGENHRADVLAIHPATRRTVAWEIQLSTISVDDITTRNQTLQRAGHRTCWVTTTKTAWLLRVPSARLTTDPATRAVTDGALVLGDHPAPSQWTPTRLPLPDFVAAVLVGADPQPARADRDRDLDGDRNGNRDGEVENPLRLVMWPLDRARVVWSDTDPTPAVPIPAPRPPMTTAPEGAWGAAATLARYRPSTLRWLRDTGRTHRDDPESWRRAAAWLDAGCPPATDPAHDIPAHEPGGGGPAHDTPGRD